MALTTKSKQENLGDIKLKNNPGVCICLLPSKTTSIVVKYIPNLAITCVIPPVSVQASFLVRGKYSGKKVYKHVDVQSPTLMMYGSYYETPKPGRSTLDGYQLLALDTSRTDKEIYSKPYKLANVHENGKICFGGVNRPKDLKQAFNYFWASSFNTDLSGHALSDHYKICPDIAHTYARHTGCFCSGAQKQHDSCDCSRKIFHEHRGCGCTTVIASTKCKGKCQEGLKASEIRFCKCCQAFQQHWLQVDLGTRKKRDEVTGCGCTFRHKRGCDCSKNLCDCPCTCDCCLDACNHTKECPCGCCNNTCRCECRCSKHTKFAHFMQSYNDLILPKATWSINTHLICGDKCWASPQGAEAALITNNKELLDKIPNKYWRKDKDGQPIIVASANKDKTKHRWVFESKNFIFTLPEDAVAYK